ncbi:hypothetical protein [Nostoc sp. FACHB-133]|uniref:hypothetical protein n=1 Tax=Nostoc sp. FACHB-133 TaxID=2692835 RepID=UPI001683D57E|nr:hypothetical protein [Nostoc sp. FACHB-133]MBD2527385.1 hypothetical protein [Nostoc sp. FACHB-133]
MKGLMKNPKVALLTGMLSLGIASAMTFSFAKSAAAAPVPQGMTGDYIGIGIAPGVTSGGHGGDAAQLGGDIQGRVAIPHTPLSVRGSFLFDDKTTATIPTITYDISRTG